MGNFRKPGLLEASSSLRGSAETALEAINARESSLEAMATSQDSGLRATTSSGGDKFFLKVKKERERATRKGGGETRSRGDDSEFL